MSLRCFAARRHTPFFPAGIHLCYLPPPAVCLHMQFKSLRTTCNLLLATDVRVLCLQYEGAYANGIAAPDAVYNSLFDDQLSPGVHDASSAAGADQHEHAHGYNGWGHMGAAPATQPLTPTEAMMAVLSEQVSQALLTSCCIRNLAKQYTMKLELMTFGTNIGSSVWPPLTLHAAEL